MNDLINYLKKELKVEVNFDVKFRQEMMNDIHFSLFYISSLVDSELLIRLFESIELVTLNGEKVCFSRVLDIKEETDKEIIRNSIFQGDIALIINELKKCFIIEAKKYPSRSISFPEVEKSVRGSKDSFTENLIVNVGLIRRRIKSDNLIIKSFYISPESKMFINVIYLDNVCSKQVINSLIKRINDIDVTSLIMSERALEEALFKQTYHIFPLVRYTERPDVASINLVNGKAIILVDTSSNAIITPITIFDHFKNVEEYKQNPIVGSFTKTLRFIGSISSVFLVPLFILITMENSFDNGIIPFYQLENKNPLLIEVVLVSIILEIIRIAIIHTPNAFITALSLLCAIVLGEISISLGLFSSEILLVCSLAIVLNFATPSYELSLTNRLISILFIIVSTIFGGTGFLLMLIILFIYLNNIKTLRTPYLYPFMPFDISLFNKVFLRKSSKKKK